MVDYLSTFARRLQETVQDVMAIEMPNPIGSDIPNDR